MSVSAAPASTTTAALRARRAAAACALHDHPRRAQAGWDDLAAWPDWAALGDDARAALALRAGAWWHAGAWQHCINGAVLRALQAELGPDAFARLLSAGSDVAGAASGGSSRRASGAVEGGGAAEAVAPPEDAATLARVGLEALLASVASPLLRVVLREQFAPATLPPLPALDAARARRAVKEAQASPHGHPRGELPQACEAAASGPRGTARSAKEAA